MQGRQYKRTVACVKWGQKFTPDYVNVLYRAVCAHLTPPFRFVCMTDDARGIVDGVEILDFPDFSVPRKTWPGNCLPKIGLLAPDILDDDEVVLHLDLDILVMGDLAPMFELYDRRPAFYSLREWNSAAFRALLPLTMRPDRGTQGSVYLYRVGEQRHMFEQFNRDILGVFAKFRSDRQYFPTIAAHPAYLPEAWVVSYKKHCLRNWPASHFLGHREPPESTKIVVFHGDPKPSDLFGPKEQRWGAGRKFGRGPVPWVRDYWLRYGGQLPQVGASA